MSAAEHIRLLVDPPAAGSWNMALDEALAQSAAEHGHATVRFYGWDQPTLSLGYFQALSERRQHPASGVCPVVRRASGGGAIIHDRELTYSIVLPAEHRLAAQPELLYRAAHVSLIDVFRHYGAAACLHSDLPAEENRGFNPKAFLCFERRADGDVVVGPAKIAGSAQRRRRGAVLQHGSVLLATSAAAPELPGLEEAAGISLSPKQLLTSWTNTLCRELDMTIDVDELSSAERDWAKHFETRIYRNAAWTQAR